MAVTVAVAHATHAIGHRLSSIHVDLHTNRLTVACDRDPPTLHRSIDLLPLHLSSIAELMNTDLDFLLRTTFENSFDKF